MDVANDLASRWDAGFLGDRFPVLFAALDAGEAILDGAFVGLGPGLLAEVLDRADEEAPPLRSASVGSQLLPCR